jgi:N-acetylglucosaminyl-diphospho-decaprenol L-rhamnosyltransferase
VPELRVIIVTYNNESTIEGCLIDALAATESIDRLVTVVDNASADDTMKLVESGFDDTELMPLQTNIGFSAANNVVLRQTECPFVLLLNPDTRIAPDAVAILMRTLKQHPRVALVGPRMQYPDGSPQVSFGPFPGLLRDYRQRRIVQGCRDRKPGALCKLERMLIEPFSPAWVSGSCFLARTQALREVDFFDTDFVLYLEDVEICKRLAAAGWRVMLQPEALCLHIEGASQPDAAAMRRHFQRSRLLYANKHAGRLSFQLYKILRARGTGLYYDRSKRFRSWRKR